MKRILCLIWVASGIALTSAVECRAQLPDGPVKPLSRRRVAPAMLPRWFLGKAMNAEQWNAEVASMVGKGAEISDADFAQIVEYLATNRNSLPPTTATAERPMCAGAFHKE